MTGPEVLQRALLKWGNAYAAQKQAEATHRATVEQLEAAEYELAVVLGRVPAPQAAPPQYAPYPSPQGLNTAHGYTPPFVPPPPRSPAAPPASPAPNIGAGAVVDDGRPADEIVLEYMQRNGVGGGGVGG